MCTTVLLFRPAHDWPVILAANRDEMLDRPWEAPARHWPDRDNVTAGRDVLAGGSWLGMNDDHVVAAILNRQGSLGPAQNKRSRGELVLDALDHAEASAAAMALSELNGAAYRPFNLVVADPVEAFWLRHDGRGPIKFEALPPGISMLTAHGLNSPDSLRVRQHLAQFEAAESPDPDVGDWQEWEDRLASRETGPDNDPQAAMCIGPVGGFGTVNASLIAMPHPRRTGQHPIWRFAGGPPNEFSFNEIIL